MDTRTAPARPNFILLLFLVAALLTGCGSAKVDELRTYRDAMTGFFDRLADYDRAIRGIDPEEEGASQEFLSLIDSVADECVQIAAIDTPEEYLPVQESSIRLSRDMQLSRDAFHTAFEGESFNAEAFSEAMENYEKANQGLQEMIRILHSEG